jgi:diguanylate cyclase (GGDEF)-like protein
MGTTAPAPTLPAVPDARVDRTVLRALVRLASLVTGSHDALSTIEAVAETARDLLDAASLSIESRDEHAQVLTTLVNVGDLGPGEVRWPTDEKYDLAAFPQTLAVLGTGAHTVSLAHLGDPSSDPAELALLERLGKASCLNAPIVVDGALWGLLYATRHAHQPPFDSYTAELSEVVAGLISAGLVQAAAWQRLQQLASTDPLTGLANRRVFDEGLAGLLAGSVGPPGFGLVLADVNGLKRVNDSLGHPAGDETLMAVAAAARRAVTDVPGAVTARLGGDEFALLLPAVDRTRALEVADAWCRACENGRHGTSLSTGLITVAGGRHQAAAVFGGADRALYAAKQSRSTVPVLAQL